MKHHLWCYLHEMTIKYLEIFCCTGCWVYVLTLTQHISLKKINGVRLSATWGRCWRFWSVWRVISNSKTGTGANSQLIVCSAFSGRNFLVSLDRGAPTDKCINATKKVFLPSTSSLSRQSFLELKKKSNLKNYTLSSCLPAVRMGLSQGRFISADHPVN